MSLVAKNRFGRLSWWSKRSKKSSWLREAQQKLAGTTEKNVSLATGARVRKPDLGA